MTSTMREERLQPANSPSPSPSLGDGSGNEERKREKEVEDIDEKLDKEWTEERKEGDSEGFEDDDRENRSQVDEREVNETGEREEGKER